MTVRLLAFGGTRGRMRLDPLKRVARSVDSEDVETAVWPAPQALGEKLDRVFRAAASHGATDVHLRPGEPVRLRMGDQLVAARAATVDAEDLLALVARARHPAAANGWRQVDFSLPYPGVGRLRVHAFRERDRACAVVRIVPERIPTLKDLRLPPALGALTDYPHGLVLVTGATGVGKSTTLASLLQRTAEERAVHIVTLEDPIEFEIASERSAVSQREIGGDVADFAEGIRAAMREDPDIVMVGEIRDLETLRATLLAAESGHLVLSTMHTRDAPATVSKIVGFFPTDEQPLARARLAECMVATLSQVLLPVKGSTARAVATELMTATPSVRERIRDGARGGGLVEAMERGRGEGGMHAFEESLLGLVRAGLIDPDVARHAARSPADFVRVLRAEGVL